MGARGSREIPEFIGYRACPRLRLSDLVLMLSISDRQHKKGHAMRHETMTDNQIGASRTTLNPALVDAGGALPWEPTDTPSGVSELTDDRLTTQIVSLTTQLSQTTYDLLVLIGELDERGTYTLSGALSCAAWLAERCDIERVTAHNHVRVARAMRRFTDLDTAMATGDISYAKARMLTPHLTTEHVGDLVQLATITPTTRLAYAIAQWSHRHESQTDIDTRHHHQRSLTWRTDPDGMITITARLTPTAAAAICATIDKTVTTTPTPADRRADEPRHPTLAQQRADALVTILTESGTGSVDTEVIIHVTQDGNHLPDGTPLTDHAVTTILPDAFVSLLLHDNQRHPIDASPRRRFPTRRQRHVFDARHDHCQHPGCDARTLLQYDHIEPYATGGPTTLDNLQRLCGPHNRAKHPTQTGSPSP